MRRIASVFLAGPDLFFPDAVDHFARKHAMCEAAGFTALSAHAAELVEAEPSEAMAREIYASAVASLRRADALIANLSPWRGPGCDAGTAFETGFAAGLGKPVFAYMNVAEEDDAEQRWRVLEWVGGDIGADGRWRDSDGAEIEDFGLPESLMLWAEARRLYVIVTPDPVFDLTGLELCLQAMKLYAD
jgi:nucleoside 2-deoxyribosyltransferase